MKIKINQILKSVDGVEPLKGEKGRPLTLKDVCINSVLTPAEGDDEKKKFEKWEIFKKLRDNENEVELSIEESATLKKAVGKIQSVLIMGQVFEFLESNKK
jgi:hypothetical protein